MQKKQLICSVPCEKCQGRSYSNVESAPIEDSFDANKEACDVSLLGQFTCTQVEEDKQGKEEAEVSDNCDSDG